jgi:hypothetical protein
LFLLFTCGGWAACVWGPAVTALEGLGPWDTSDNPAGREHASGSVEFSSDVSGSRCFPSSSSGQLVHSWHRERILNPDVRRLELCALLSFRRHTPHPLHMEVPTGILFQPLYPPFCPCKNIALVRTTVCVVSTILKPRPALPFIHTLLVRTTPGLFLSNCGNLGLFLQGGGGFISWHTSFQAAMPPGSASYTKGFLRVHIHQTLPAWNRSTQLLSLPAMGMHP